MVSNIVFKFFIRFVGFIFLYIIIIIKQLLMINYSLLFKTRLKTGNFARLQSVLSELFLNLTCIFYNRNEINEENTYRRK